MRITKGSRLKTAQGRKSSNGYMLYPDDVFEVISKNFNLPDVFIHGVTPKWRTIKIKRVGDNTHFYAYPDAFVQFEEVMKNNYSIF